MIIKTAKLEGTALDWAVARIYGAPDELATKQVMDGYSLSANWSVGGPLIEQYKAEFRVRGDFYECRIEMWDDEGIGYDEIKTTGADHLTAAMRAIVAAKLGDTVDVPEDLCQ